VRVAVGIYLISRSSADTPYFLLTATILTSGLRLTLGTVGSIFIDSGIV